MNFFSLKVTRKVKGHNKEGRRPYVYYEGVKYSNEVLLRSPQLINKSLELLINTDDLRVIKAFLTDGSELGNLTAIGKWGVNPHNLRTRKAINKLKNNKMIHFNQYEDPINVYQNYLEKESIKNKSSRNKLASLNQSKKIEKADILERPTLKKILLKIAGIYNKTKWNNRRKRQMTTNK
ncbi:hypothetical protein ACT7CY_27485 [Bacillus pacificus]